MLFSKNEEQNTTPSITPAPLISKPATPDTTPKQNPDRIFRDNALALIVTIEDFNKGLRFREKAYRDQIQRGDRFGQDHLDYLHQEMYVQWGKVDSQIKDVRDGLAQRNIKDQDLDTWLQELHAYQVNSPLRQGKPINATSPYIVDEVTSRLREMLDRVKLQ